MADETAKGPTTESPPPAAETAPVPAPKRRRSVKAAKPSEPASPEVVTAKELRAPKRAALDPATARALLLRREADRHRPLFVRQAAHRYARIGREESWRRPRGLQSKQRRHYGYRSVVVRIGYRSPARARGLVPSGFRPVIVRTPQELARIDAQKEAVIIARTVGTRRRLALEEAARRLGLHLLNPIATPESEE